MNRLRCGAILMALVLVMIASATRAGAKTLSDYEHRVSIAANLIEELRGAGEDERNPQPGQFITTNLIRTRELLPATETVTLDGRSITVNNSWLHESLAEYEKGGPAAARAEILMRVSERLRALDERLRQMVDGKIPAETDKDADKGRLAEILRRPEYMQTAPQGSALERLLERFFRWLGKLFPSVKPIAPGSSRAVSGAAQVIVVVICLVAIAFLIWKLGPRFMQGRRKKKTKREARIVLGERLEPDQTAADLLAQAEALAKEGNLRAAIRKAYIALLCELGDRKMLSLAQHKTNRDYLYALRDKASLYASMRKLTNSFELHWYGFVPVGETDWSNFRAAYREIVKREE